MRSSFWYACGWMAVAGTLTLALGQSARAGGWVLPDRQIGRHTAPLLILSRPEVQADLKLDPKDAEKVERTIVELYTKAQPLVGRRDPEAIAARRAIDEAHQTWLQANLSESQRSRLTQIDLQWEGPAALHTRPIVADTLRLTTAQRQKLTDAFRDRESKRATPGRDSRADDLAFAETVLSLLDEEQKGRWKSMLGHPCPFKIAPSR
jgi:hypothetical protein